jgi:hypothetical protein
MKARIGETDSSANKGEIFYREVNATFDIEKDLIYIYTDGNADEIVNMRSPNFHSIKFIR